MEKKLHSDFLKVRSKNTYFLPHVGGLIGGEVMCPRLVRFDKPNRFTLTAIK